MNLHRFVYLAYFGYLLHKDKDRVGLLAIATLT